MSYKIKLDIFEGPFDLLLFLIRKNEVDIYDIPIAEIMEQFIEYIEAMKSLDLDVAGDFIEMVAILMHIKARLLLPKQQSGDEEPEDPRTELVEKLIEYKRFKEASYELNGLYEQRQKLIPRKYFEFIPKSEDNISDEDFVEKATLFNLLLAFRRALDNMPKVNQHVVTRIEVTIEDQTEYILKKLDLYEVLIFQDLMKEIKERIVLIVTFVALLDMIKNGLITVRQSDVYNEIRIKKKSHGKQENN
jgi:segregation and condensation protein A